MTIIMNSDEQPVTVSPEGADEVMQLRRRIAKLEAENKRLRNSLDKITSEYRFMRNESDNQGLFSAIDEAMKHG